MLGRCHWSMQLVVRETSTLALVLLLVGCSLRLPPRQYGGAPFLCPPIVVATEHSDRLLTVPDRTVPGTSAKHEWPPRRPNTFGVASFVPPGVRRPFRGCGSEYLQS